MREILIEPVTRIEGHSRITVELGEDGEVTEARFEVTQFRGFERLCQGRPLAEMPTLMERICGICPVSHLVASAKACDAILGVEIPPAAGRLRELMNLAQIVQSHALNLFYLSAPDLLLGFDADPRRRNLAGVLEQAPQLARDGVGLRRFGQQVIERLGGKRVHPGYIVPGGVERPLEQAERDAILAAIPEAREAAARALAWYLASLGRFTEEAAVLGDFPSLYVGLVDAQRRVAYTDGLLEVTDAAGEVLVHLADPTPYREFFAERVEPWSYLKSTYFRPLGWPAGIYRVGPLARLNVAASLGTEAGDAALAEYRQRLGRSPSSSFHYYDARLIEIVHCIDAIEQLLADPQILDTDVRARAEPNRSEGVGVCEAPRGLLVHHYRVDGDGLVTWANLVVATGHNNPAMNRGVTQVARHYVHGDHVEEGMLNRVEAVIRCFDPCLSCSTHALGEMPLAVEIRAADGTLLREVTR